MAKREGDVKAHAVIGAGYGDEGKGVLVDRLTSLHPDAVVVRTNGGAQAGHTVVTPEGVRHVFHHFGSGSLAGARTHLSSFFVANPMMFHAEREQLVAKGANVEVSIDPDALLTTPFDVMINQAVEMARGEGRHGSCGLGFGETLERDGDRRYRLTVGSAAGMGPHDLRERIARIGAQWMPHRLERLGVVLPPELSVAAEDTRLIDAYVGDLLLFLDRVVLRRDRELRDETSIVFEAAQGLMLDQDMGAFPYVTRSNTGMRNIAVIARRARIERIDAVYVTRAYVTRHGAGPLAHEELHAGDFSVYDPTNVPNDWQGSLRFAPLDLGVLRDAITADLDGLSDLKVLPSIAIGCLDQAVEERVRVYRYGDVERVLAQYLPLMVSRHLRMPLHAQGWGPTRDDYGEELVVRPPEVSPAP